MTVALSGAGISVNADGQCSRWPSCLSTNIPVPDFWTLRKPSQGLFDISVYNTSDGIKRFHTLICDIARRSLEAKPTTFHKFLDTLAARGNLLRHYIQNIDYIERRLPDL